MGDGKPVTVTLAGGGPWGFRLQGGGNQSLLVSKIRKRSKAHANDLREGDILVAVNGQPLTGRSHQDVMDDIDNASDQLVLNVIRGGSTQSQPTPIANRENACPVTKPTEVTSPPPTESVPDTPAPQQTHNEQNKEVLSDGAVPSVVNTQVISANNVDNILKPSGQISFEQIPLNQSVKPPVTAPKVSPKPAPKPQRPQLPQPVQQPFQSLDKTFPQYSGEEMKENIAPDRKYSTDSQNSSGVPLFNVSKLPGAQQNVWQPGVPQKSDAPKVEPKTIPKFNVSKFQPGQSVPDNADTRPQLPEFPTSLYDAPFAIRRYTDTAHADLGGELGSSGPALYDPHFIPGNTPLRDPYSDDEDEGHSETRNPMFGPAMTTSGSDVGKNRIRQRGGSVESDSSTPESSLANKKKLYADSAFYDDAGAVYPTIQEQVKLCKTIATSLTSNANKKARGARMFAKRQRRAAKWVHDGASSGEDIGDIRDLDSELSPADGGTKPLFTFRIPSVKTKLDTSTSPQQKMSLNKEQFEKLRFIKEKCDHRGVSPNLCFNLATDLQNKKGKGGKIFQKRKAKSDDWVIDATNVHQAPARAPKPEIYKLNSMLKNPPKPVKTPWEAALDDPSGSVEAAFGHLDELERIRDSLTRSALSPPNIPMTMPPGGGPSYRHTSLAGTYQGPILKGKDFNRSAKGWVAPDEDIGRRSKLYEEHDPIPLTYTDPQRGPAMSHVRFRYRNFNNVPKLWRRSYGGEALSYEDYAEPLPWASITNLAAKTGDTEQAASASVMVDVEPPSVMVDVELPSDKKVSTAANLMISTDEKSEPSENEENESVQAVVSFQIPTQSAKKSEDKKKPAQKGKK